MDFRDLDMLIELLGASYDPRHKRYSSTGKPSSNSGQTIHDYLAASSMEHVFDRFANPCFVDQMRC